MVRDLFFLNIYKTSKVSTGVRVSLVFQITQHTKDVMLLKSFENYFKCGKTYIKGNISVYQVCNLSDILKVIIPFFKKHRLFGVKFYDFND